jgi:hypothetical protein
MGEGATIEELEEMVAEKRRRSEEENRIRAERIKKEEEKREAERLEAEKVKTMLQDDPRGIAFSNYLNDIDKPKDNNDNDPEEKQ